MQIITDEQIMARVQAGSLDELSEIFSRYQTKIYNFYYRMCWDREVCRDLTQSVFERVVKYRNSYNEQHAFKSWIFQIARNLYKDHLGKQKLQFSDYADLETVKESDPGGLARLERSQQEEALHEALNQLPDERRELIVLSRFQGMKYEEISELTGLTVANIKVNIHRAMKQLRELYFATN